MSIRPKQRGGAFRHCPRPAACSAANYDATGPYAGSSGRLWPHRTPAQHRPGTTRSTSSTPSSIHADDPERRALPPILGQAPCMRRDLVGPLPSSMQFEYTHKQPLRDTLSATIASQTIASSPDGSVISSAARSACGTPAVTVGGGCRFRASSTVTSSSSPCSKLGHSRTCSSRQEKEARRALPTATHSSLLLRTVPCEPVESLFSTPRGPSPNLAAVHAHRQAQWQVGNGFLGLPYRTKYRNCKARQEVSGGNIAVCGVCT